MLRLHENSHGFSSNFLIAIPSESTLIGFYHWKKRGNCSSSCVLRQRCCLFLFFRGMDSMGIYLIFGKKRHVSEKVKPTKLHKAFGSIKQSIRSQRRKSLFAAGFCWQKSIRPGLGAPFQKDFRKHSLEIWQWEYFHRNYNVGPLNVM